MFNWSPCIKFCTVYSVMSTYLKTASYEILAFIRHLPPELELRRADLVIRLEGDVALDHVEEKDAETPHGGGSAEVAVAGDPLRRGVHTGTVEIRVRGVLHPKNVCHNYYFVNFYVTTTYLDLRCFFHKFCQENLEV